MTGVEAQSAEGSSRVSCMACVAWLWALMLVNELWSAAGGLLGHFAHTKVMMSLGDELADLGLALAGQALVLLLGAGLMAALPCLAWAAVSCACRRSLDGLLGVVRWRRWVFWFLATAGFFQVWYALHGFLLPGSRLSSSWLACMVCVPHFSSGGPVGDTPRLAGLALGLPLVLLITARALWCSARLRRRLAAALSLLLLLELGGSWWLAPGAPRPFTASGHVILIGVDSLQANRLALGGGSPGLTPHIDHFFEQALHFDNAWTPFARTYPSWLSLLTGRDPPRHGARFNLAPDTGLASDNSYLPQRFADAGYQTLHATDECRFSIMRPRFGFERLLHPVMGVADFLLGSLFDFSAANLARQSRLGALLFPVVDHNRALPSYNGDLFADDVIALLDELPRDRPVFAAVHLCGNHYPFTTPWPYARQGDDEVQSSIAMVDAQVGRLLDWLDASGLSRAGTTVLLSDHGDGWSGVEGDQTNEHGDDLHQALANKVLLALRGPTIPRRGSVTDLVRTTDLAPTLLQLAGLPWDPSRLDGRPLQAWIEGRGESEAPRSLFAESGVPRAAFGLSAVVARHVDCYQVQPHTGLVFLKPSGLTEFMATKSYMLLEGTMRLVLCPATGRFQLTRVDPSSGRDLPGPVEWDQARRAHMLGRLIDHNGLDRQGLMDLARARGFLAPTMARSERLADGPAAGRSPRGN